MLQENFNVFNKKKDNYSQDKRHYFAPETTLTSKGSDRPYNILRAVANKRAAFEHFNHKMFKDEMQNNHNSFEATSKSTTRNSPNDLDVRDTTAKLLSEKGVQCYVEKESFKPSTQINVSDNIGSYSMDSIDIHYTQSEHLRKPNIFLTPSRISDPCLYRPSRSSFITERSPRSKEGSIENFMALDMFTPQTEPEKDQIHAGVTSDHHVSHNSKGRPPVTSPYNIRINPLEIPADFNLISNSLEPAMSRDSKEKISSSTGSGVNIEGPAVNGLVIPSSLSLNTSFNDSTTNDRAKRSSSAPAVASGFIIPAPSSEVSSLFR